MSLVKCRRRSDDMGAKTALDRVPGKRNLGREGGGDEWEAPCGGRVPHILDGRRIVDVHAVGDVKPKSLVEST